MTKKVIYECGCTSGGDLISPYCPIHTNMPIVKETEFDVRQAQEYGGGHIETATGAGGVELSTKHDLNSRYGVAGRTVRPMIQFVDETTESRLKDIREQMTFTRAKNTIRRTGWYYTEPGTPCGYMTTQEIKASIANVFGA